MNLNVKLFAAARELAGHDTLPVALEDGATVADLRRALIVAVPELAMILAHVRFAVDAEYADEHTSLIESADVACIPPVSGG